MEENEQGISAFPAAIRATNAENRDELMRLARKRAHDPKILDELPPFFWPAIISNTRLDAYWTHMARSSLENFARGAIEGVAFQNSHRWNELPLGGSLTGVVEELADGLVQVVSDFYTLEGLTLNGISTDQFIRGVRSGIVKDVSIGFSGGTRICDICNQNFFRCPHWPGMIYEIEQDGVIRQVRATVTVENAKLHEVSAVYDGATPGAVILKARAAAADGRLRSKEALMLEEMYRVSLPLTRQFSGVDVGDEPAQDHTEGRNMTILAVLDKLNIGKGLEEGARAAALEARFNELLAAESNLATVTSNLETVTSDLATANGRIAVLEPQAKDGEQYRTDLTAEALAAGVRALGSDFDEATYKESFANASLAVLKRSRDDWNKMGDIRFPGGRHTNDDHQRNPNGGNPPDVQSNRAVIEVPDRAYSVRG